MFIQVVVIHDEVESQRRMTGRDQIVVDVFIEGASGQGGVEVTFAWDPMELEYVSANAVDVFSGAVAIPTQTDSTIQLSYAFLGTTSSKDAGSAVQATFAAASTFSGTTTLRLKEAKLAGDESAQEAMFQNLVDIRGALAELKCPCGHPRGTC